MAKVILRLRELVREKYGDKAANIDKMFNIAICNFYTEREHKINEHRDDERWLEFNELDSQGNPCASGIASMTFYPDNDDPGYYRNFEIYDENKNGWEKITQNIIQYCFSVIIDIDVKGSLKEKKMLDVSI